MTGDHELWYCRALGVELGPMPLDIVLQLINDGELNSEDEVRCGKTGPWLALNTVTADAADTRCGNVAPNDGIDCSQNAVEREIRSQENSEEKWYSLIDGIEYGPARFQHLQNSVASGTVSADDYVKQGKNGGWIAVRSVPGLVRTGGHLDTVRGIGTAQVSVNAPMRTPNSVSQSLSHAVEPIPKALPTVARQVPHRFRKMSGVLRRSIEFLGVHLYSIVTLIIWAAVTVVVLFFLEEENEASEMILEWLRSPVFWVWIFAFGVYLGAALAKFRGW